MRTLSRFAVARPLATLTAATLITLVAAPGLARLELRTDGHALVPRDAEAVRLDTTIRERFGIEDLLIVLIRTTHPDGIYNPETLDLVRALTRDIAAVEGLSPDAVMSLATEKGDRYRQGTFDFWPFLEPLPETPEALSRLRDDLETLAIHVGTLVSDDGTAAAIHVGVPADADRTRLYATLARICADADARGAENAIDLIGAPVAESLLGAHILDDLGVPRWFLGATVARTHDDHETGPPGSLYGWRRLIGRTIGLVPLAIALMMLVFLAAFRRPAAMVIPLVEVGACLVFVFGLMGWIGVPVYLTVAVLPIILTSIGVADEVHVLSRYARRLRSPGAGDHIDAVRATMDDLAGPIVRTSLTTAAAFCAFALSPIDAVRAFGLLAAAGITFCMVWSLAATPALLVLVPPSWLRRRDAASGRGSSRWLGVVAGVATRRRALVLAAAAVVLVVAPFGVRRVLVSDSWISGFDPASSFARATRWFDEHFFGAHVLLVRVETGAGVFAGDLAPSDIGQFEVSLPGDAVPDPSLLAGNPIVIARTGASTADPLPEDAPVPPPSFTSWIESAKREGDRLVVAIPRRTGSPGFGLRPREGEGFRYEITLRRLAAPEVLRLVGRLETRIEEQRDLGVGGVLGPAAYVETTNYILKKRDEGARAIPETPVDVRNLWIQYERIRGSVRARQLIDAGYTEGLIHVFLRNANFTDTERLIRVIRDHERTELASRGVRLSLAGDVAVSQALIEAIVETQIRSLLLSLAVILLITTALHRSWHWGVYCLVPCALAVLLNFAFMGWSGMPLGVATSMFAGMILGIGVDYAIHLLAGFRVARARGAGVEAAVVEAAATVGPAIVIDGLAVAIGFGVLCLSQVPANARLGQLAILCIASCLAATILLLPALLRWRPPPTRTRP